MSRIRLAVLIAAMAATASAQDRQATPAESLREAWIGKLNMGGVEPVMQFRIMDIATGEPVVYFDSITEGRNGFRGTWSRKDTTLIFEIPAITLTFTGTLNETGDVAEGTWRQGGRDSTHAGKARDRVSQSQRMGESPAASAAALSLRDEGRPLRERGGLCHSRWPAR